jgi:hypothetical protein
MAGEDVAPTDVPLLRGLFGTLQAGAAAGSQTADIWQDLRVNAGSWQFAAQGVAQPYDMTAVEEAGRQILSAQGINGATVSTFRGVAGQWLGAKQALANLDPGQQITAGAIFVPPWSQTAGDLTPSRYRIRTQWQFTNAAGVDVYQWRADELSGPLTTPADATVQAMVPANTYPPQALLAGSELPVLSDFEIEQI